MRTSWFFGIVLVAIACERQPQRAAHTETPTIAPKDNAMNWDDPRDPVAVSVPEVVAGKTSIVLVIHDSGHGGWQFMDGLDVKGRKPVVMPKDVLLRLDPSLVELKDLPVGWRARRASSKDPWVREKNLLLIDRPLNQAAKDNCVYFGSYVSLKLAIPSYWPPLSGPSVSIQSNPRASS